MVDDVALEQVSLQVPLFPPANHNSTFTDVTLVFFVDVA
jgi:hypothetical protein